MRANKIRKKNIYILLVVNVNDIKMKLLNSVRKLKKKKQQKTLNDCTMVYVGVQRVSASGLFIYSYNSVK